MHALDKTKGERTSEIEALDTTITLAVKALHTTIGLESTRSRCSVLGDPGLSVLVGVDARASDVCVRRTRIVF